MPTRIELDAIVTPLLTQQGAGDFITGAEIREARGHDMDYVDQQDATKQATLVSGTNIKAINGVSILGSGSLTVSGSVEVAYSTTLPLNYSRAIMASHAITADATFTAGGTLTAGSGGTVELQADGSHTVTLPSDWIDLQDGAEVFDETDTGAWYMLVWDYNGTRVTYTWQRLGTGVVLTTPAAPTSFVVDDTADTGNWTNNPLYTALSDYEYTLNGGSSYAVVTAKPLSVGDVALSIGMVGVRVKAVPGVSNPSLTLYNGTAYTESGLSTPDTPTVPVTDDTANTFSWTDSAGYTDATDYEYTTNAGSSYSDVTVKPISIGNVALAIGQVGVRVKAVPSVSNASGTLFDTAGFNLITPAAPITPVTDDTANTYGWTDQGGKTFADAEYTVNAGSSWADATANPQTGIGNVNKAAGQVGVRYKAVPSVSNASAVLYNTVPFLITPAAPTVDVVDDTADTFNWTNSAGFTAPTDYEWRIGGAGAFTGVTAKPHSVGDVAIPIGDFEIRVKAVAGVNTASASLTNSDAFTLAPAGAFPVSEDFEGTSVGNIPTGWAATAGLAVSAAGTINGAQELALPSAAGAKFMAYSGGVSGIATAGTVLLRKLTPAATGSGGIFLRANSAVPASITDAYVAWLQFGPSPVLMIYKIETGTGYTLLLTSPYNPTLTGTDVYTFTYDVDAAHLHTIRIQRSSDSFYMDNIGAWGATPTDALTHTEGSPAHTSAGHVGFWAGDLPGTADAYADDISFT